MVLVAAVEDAQTWAPLARGVAVHVRAAGVAVLVVGDAAAVATCEREAAVAGEAAAAGEAGSVVEVEGMVLAEILVFDGALGAGSLAAWRSDADPRTGEVFAHFLEAVLLAAEREVEREVEVEGRGIGGRAGEAWRAGEE